MGMKLNKKLVQGLIVGATTIAGAFIAACIKEKPEAIETGETMDVPFEEIPETEVGTEEVTEE